LQRLGISRKTFYRDVAAGRIKVIKHGGRTFVAAAEIARLCAA
jgi:predicted site-specific integrase-resolvase